MNLLLSTALIIISIIGGAVLWIAFWYNDLNIVNTSIWFTCMVVPEIINSIYEDNLRIKYEYPNRKKQITFEGEVFKKNTFKADFRLKGFIPSRIIWFIGCLPLFWWLLGKLYRGFQLLLLQLFF